MTARTPSGASAIPAPSASKAHEHKTMQAQARRSHPGRKTVIEVLAVAALALCAFQFGDRYGLNSMPFAQVQGMISDLAGARRMAKQGNVDLFVGQTMQGQAVKIRGEVTDANCYLGTHRHAYDHAFCAKMCAAAGGPLVFVPDRGGQPYLVLSERNGVKLSDNVLDRIGIPGIVLKGKVFDADGIHVLAVDGLAQ